MTAGCSKNSDHEITPDPSTKDEKIEYDNRDYYINHENFLNNPNIKCLVNMNKATKRGEFLTQNNIRIRNIKNSDSGTYAEILMFHLTDYEAHIVPIWVSVELQNTKDGMRISGGNVIYAFSNWYDSSFSFVKDDEDVFCESSK